MMSYAHTCCPETPPETSEMVKMMILIYVIRPSFCVYLLRMNHEVQVVQVLLFHQNSHTFHFRI